MKNQIYLSFVILLVLAAGCSPAGQSGLEGTTWVLTAIGNTSLIAGTTATLAFEGGQVSGSASCNHFGGSYTVNGEGISFEAIFSTEMYCMDPEGIMEQENVYLQMLGTAERYALADGRLTIFTGNGPLTFDKQP